MNEGGELKSNSSDEGGEAAGRKPFKRAALNTVTNTEDLTTLRGTTAVNN